MELVQPDQVGPVGGEVGGVGVRVGDRAQLGCAEQVQHGQVGQPVTAVRRRVDQHHTGLGEDHVAGPEVAVDPGRWPAVVELTPAEPLDDPVDQGPTTRSQTADRGGRLGVGEQSLVGVERAPALGGAERQRLGADVPVARPPLGPGPVRRRAGGVGDGQRRSERGRRLRGRPDRVQPRQDQALRRHLEHLDDPGRLRTGGRQPGEAGRLGRIRVGRGGAGLGKGVGHEQRDPARGRRLRPAGCRGRWSCRSARGCHPVAGRRCRSAGSG